MIKGIVTANMPGRTAEPKFLMVRQLPTRPIPPPPVDAQALGLITWDLPKVIDYTPLSTVTANLEMLNPSSEDRLYCIAYYFIDKTGLVADEGIVVFAADSFEFKAFYLPAGGVEPAFTIITFSAPDRDYIFGLRMLLLEMTDSVAVVIEEVSRLEVLLASVQAQNWQLVGSMISIVLLGAMCGIVLSRTRGG